MCLLFPWWLFIAFVITYPVEMFLHPGEIIKIEMSEKGHITRLEGEVELLTQVIQQMTKLIGDAVIDPETIRSVNTQAVISKCTDLFDEIIIAKFSREVIELLYPETWDKILAKESQKRREALEQQLDEEDDQDDHT